MRAHTLTTVTRAVDVTRCPCCKGVTERLYALPGWRSRCWGCLLRLMVALDEAMKQDDMPNDFRQNMEL